MIFRDRREADFGCDATLEAIEEGFATNCCSDVQIRARTDAHVNADRSVSLRVEVSNLNYLLNGTSPIYFLYRPTQRDVMYVWAQDEAKRLNASEPDWMEKKSVTVRFNTRLNRRSARGIRDRILDEADMRRQVRERIDSVASARSFRIGIDLDASCAEGPDQAEKFLLEEGLRAASAGKYESVLARAGLLLPSSLSRPLIQLVLGYAYYCKGHLLEALTHLARAQLFSQELCAHDRCLLEFLGAAVEVDTGLITNLEFLTKVSQVEQTAPRSMAIQSRLISLHQALRYESDVVKRVAARAELLEAVTRAYELADEYAFVHCYAKVVELEVRSEELVNEMGQALILSSQSEKLLSIIYDGKPVEKVVQEANLGWVAIERDFLTLQELVERIEHGFLICLVHLQREVARVAFTSSAHLAAYIRGRGEMPPDEGALVRIGRVIQLAQHHGQAVVELRAQFLRARVLELLGKRADAMVAAAEVERAARAMRVADVEGFAREFQKGVGTQEEVRRKVDANRALSHDELWLTTSDEELETFAWQLSRQMRLPSERDSVVLGEFWALRSMARQRDQWCGFLEHLESKDHLGNEETRYRRAPEKLCRCEKFGHMSRFGYGEIDAVVAAFRQAYCAACTSRAPGIKRGR